jgi:hypothetical protein
MRDGDGGFPCGAISTNGNLRKKLMARAHHPQRWDGTVLTPGNGAETATANDWMHDGSCLRKRPNRTLHGGHSQSNVENCARFFQRSFSDLFFDYHAHVSDELTNDALNAEHGTLVRHGISTSLTSL